MKETIKRELNRTEIVVIFDGKEIKVNEREFLKDKNVQGTIRIQKKDYAFINEKKGFITHFNLECSGHKKNENYLLPIIEKRGFFDGKKEVMPVLNFNGVYLCKCIDVKNNVSYENITKEDFKYSFENIKNIFELKAEILFRYKTSMPHLSDEEILSKGVGITYLQILGKYNLKTNKLDKVDKINSISEKINLSYYSKLDLKSKGSTGQGAVKKTMSFFGTLSGEKGSTRQGFGLGILAAAKINNNIVALTADLKGSVCLDAFEKEFPNNFYEFGISEQNMMSAAAGMCLNNKIPFVTSFAVFNPGRNWDQLRVSVCYSNHNVKILGSHAGLTTGPDGATHQALEDIAITRVLPNLVVIVPCDEEEARKASIAASEHIGPVYLRVSREKSLIITNKDSEFKIGKANVLDDGSDVTIIACGLTVQFALEAKEILLKEKINAAVINLHTIKPLDKKTILEYAKKTGKIVTIEEHQKAGGMGSAVCEFLAENYPVPVEIIGVEDTFGESGEGYELLKKYNISTEEIVKRVKKVMKR